MGWLQSAGAAELEAQEAFVRTKVGSGRRESRYLIFVRLLLSIQSNGTRCRRFGGLERWKEPLNTRVTDECLGPLVLQRKRRRGGGIMLRVCS